MPLTDQRGGAAVADRVQGEAMRTREAASSSGNNLPARVQLSQIFRPHLTRLHANRPETEAVCRGGRGRVRAEAGGVPRSVLVDQAAALLGLSRRTVYYRIRAGKLATLRTRCGSQRVLMASIEGLLREMGQKAVGGAVPAAVEDLPGRDDLTIGQDAGI
jgi:excisionase family DNA binding protein